MSNVIPDIDDVPEAADTIKKVQEALEDARTKMEQAQRRQAYYANSSRRQHIFNEGDKVMLRTSNYVQRLRRQAGNTTSTSLMPRYLGPYKIKTKHSDLVYELELPASWGNARPVFHISQLQAYRESPTYRHQQRPPRQAPSGLIPVLSGDEVFGVLGRKYFGHTTDDGHMYKYLVKWKNQGDSSNQ